MSKVVQDGGCQLWPGPPNAHGYGYLYDKGVKAPVLAHRRAYESAKGPIPKGMCVCHTCDVRMCVNPEHLFLGTRGDNAKDRDSKDRVQHGARHWKSKLTDEVVQEMVRERREEGTTLEILGKKYGVSISVVSNVCSGKAWKRSPKEEAP